MGIEPEVRDFLKRIMFSIGAGLFWLFINITAGIFGGWFFFHDTPTKGNWIFYAWFLISMGLLLWLLIRLWSKRAPEPSEP